VRILDRYVVRSWVVIFVLTAIGFPVVSIMINMTDNLERLLDRGLKLPDIFVSYVYALPENVFLVMPAAVLFATVFTVGNLGRHSELTAAKAGGQSFFRLTLPLISPWPGWPSWYAAAPNPPAPAGAAEDRM
jgi:lipopolysaccharide export system permease protein